MPIVKKMDVGPKLHAAEGLQFQVGPPRWSLWDRLDGEILSAHSR